MVSHDQEAEAQIFVSYSRRDSAFAQWLVGCLKAEGFAAYLDKVDIAPGENWKARLAALILAADTVVFIVTAHSVASDICAWELDESARLKKRLFPIVAERIPDSSAPAILRDLNWIFCSEGDDRDEAIASLASALRTDLPWLREHTRLAALASRWQHQSRSQALTLRGADLPGAEEWLTRQPTELARPTDLHRDFIRASRRAATMRQRWFGGGAALIVVFSLVLAGWAEINRRDAQLRRDEATAQRVEAEKQRDRAEGALKDVKLQRDRAEMAVDNVVGLGESLYMVTTDFSDLLRSPSLNDKSPAFTTIKRLVNLGEELAKIMHEQRISDKTIYLIRARILMYAAKLFAEGGTASLRYLPRTGRFSL